MNDLLARAKSHYAGLPRREIRILEWGENGVPAVITWTELSVRDQDRIYAQDGGGKAASGGLVRLRAVLIKACDEDGNLLFDGMAEHDLRHNVSGDVVGRIANAILYGFGLADQDGRLKAPSEQVDDAKND